MRIGAAILAAGASTRLGRPKQLLDYRGRPLVVHVLQQLTAAGIQDTAVILGCASEAISPVLAGTPCELLDNPCWSEGIASSIRVAATWAVEQRLDALMLAACDQPRLNASHVRALWDAYAESGVAAASGYLGTCGVPAVFGASWYEPLQALSGDRGAGALLRSDSRVRVVEWADGAFDIDTEADVGVA